MINVKNQSSNFHRSLVTAKVVYEDINNRDHLVYQTTIKGTEGSQIDPGQYKDQIPQGYEFASYGNFDQQLINGHTNVIYVKQQPKSSSTVHQGMIKVDYVDNHNQLIGRHSFTGQSGKSFHIDDYSNTVPNGYRFRKVLVGSNVTQFNTDTQIVVIALNKVQVRSRIEIRYMYNGRQVGHTSVKDLEGSYFDPNPFKYQVPDHYHFAGIIGTVPKTFEARDTTVDFQVKPDQIKQSHKSIHHQDSKQTLKNNQDLGSILLKIGSSLNSLGKIIQAQNRSKR